MTSGLLAARFFRLRGPLDVDASVIGVTVLWDF
jgi:hypothetical protein